jgi:hypothetical protein
VSQWNDKSGNNRHAIQDIAVEQPETGTHTLNGRNTLHFKGGATSGHYLNVDDPIVDLATTDFTILSVTQADTGNTYDNPWSWAVGSSSPLRLEDTGEGTYKVYPSSFINPTIVLGNPTNPNIVSLRADGLLSREARYNGVLGISGSGDVLATPTDFVVGARYSYGYNAFLGTVSEIVIFNRALNDNELNVIGNYLAQKWGISWTDI